jgi:hypothetical protein
VSISRPAPLGCHVLRATDPGILLGETVAALKNRKWSRSRESRVVTLALALILSACSPSANNGDSDLTAAAPTSADYGTWAWDGTNWRQLTRKLPNTFMRNPSPGLTNIAQLAFWPEFGGLIAINASTCNEFALQPASCQASFWKASLWNGTDWVADDKFPSPPPNADARTHKPLLAWDEALGQLLDIDSDSKTIWLWSAGTWVAVVTPTAWQQAWNNGGPRSVVYDPYRQQELLLTGPDPDTVQTWTWDGKKLINLSSSPPYPDACGSLFPDGTRLVLAFCYAQILSWDGRAWSVVRGASDVNPDCPDASFSVPFVEMGFDAAHRQLVTVGPDEDTGTFHTWIWQSQHSKLVRTETRPPAQGFMSNLVFDPALPGLVLAEAEDRPWVPPGFLDCGHS